MMFVFELKEISFFLLLKVDVYCARRPNMNDWKHLGTDTTDSNGRLMYTLPSRDVEPGVYNVKMVVRLVE